MLTMRFGNRRIRRVSLPRKPHRSAKLVPMEAVTRVRQHTLLSLPDRAEPERA